MYVTVVKQSWTIKIEIFYEITYLGYYKIGITTFLAPEVYTRGHFDLYTFIAVNLIFILSISVN